MKNINFEEFCQICNDFRVTHTMSGLIADFDAALEKRLGEFATKTIFVGHDNDRESFDVKAHTFVSIIQDNERIQCTRPDGTKEDFYVV